MITYEQIVDTLLLESGQFIGDLDATLLDEKKLVLMIQRELGLYSRYYPNKQTRAMNLYNNKVFTLEADSFVPTQIVDIRTDRLNAMGYTIAPMPAAVHSYYWRYDKPILYFRYPDGEYITIFITPHEYNEEKKLIQFVELHDRFLTLLQGRFLQTVGRSRNAFTIEEIPIHTSASEMISEGKEIYDKALEEIRQNNAFNLAILI